MDGGLGAARRARAVDKEVGGDLSPAGGTREAENYEYSFPVLRIGRLIAMKDSRGVRRSLGYVKGERAISILENQAEAFDEALADELHSAGCARQYPTNIRLRGPERSDAPGAVFDFSDMAFALPNKALVLVRLCATVCISDRFRGLSLPRADEKIFSKLWIRFTLATHPESKAEDHRAVDLPAEAIAEFKLQCEKLGEKALDRLLPLYGEAMQALRSGGGTVVEFADTISVFAYGSNNKDFLDLLEEIRSGGRLRNFTRSNPSAAMLMKLGEGILGDKVGSSFDILREKGIDLRLYKTADYVEGLFLVRITQARGDTSLSEFVGLVSSPSEAEMTGAWSQNNPIGLGRSSASIATAHMISELGSYL